MRFLSFIACLALVLPLWAQPDPFIAYTRSVARAEFLFVATDPAGDIIAVGRSNDPQFAVPARAMQPRLGGGVCASRTDYPCYDVVVVKFRASDGEMIAGTFLGGSGDDLPTAMAVDSQGYVYIGGTTTSRNFPRTEGAIQDTIRSLAGTGFVTKMHNSLTGAEFSTYLGGNAPTRITAIAADRSGNAYVTGTTDARDFPRTPGAYNGTGAASMAFVTRISNGGRSLIASTFLAVGTPAAIAADVGGNAVIAGTASGDWPVTSDAYQATRRGGADLFLTRVLSTGTQLLSSTYIGGTANDQAIDLALDSNGNAYIAGVTYSPALPGTTETLGEVGTGFVLKFTGSTVAWTQPIRANGLTTVTSVQVESDGSAILSGTTHSTHFPTTSGAYHRCVVPETAVSPFYARLGPDGAIRYSTLLHENVTGEKWVATLRTGEIVTLNRPASPFEQLPASELRRYALNATASARMDCAVSAASYRNSGITGGMIVTVFGSGMGPAEGVTVAPVDGKMPTSAGGVRLLFNGTPAPLLYVRGDQINAVVPFGLEGASTAEVRVEYAGASINPLPLSVRNVEPGIFRLGSTEFGAILNQDYSVNSPSNPAARGSVVTFWATGMGPFESTYEDGAIVGANYSPLRTQARVSVGGVEGQVLYSGASPDMVAGVTQVNLRLAGNTRVSSRVPLAITLGDTTVSELAYVSVK